MIDYGIFLLFLIFCILLFAIIAMAMPVNVSSVTDRQVCIAIVSIVLCACLTIGIVVDMCIPPDVEEERLFAELYLIGNDFYVVDEHGEYNIVELKNVKVILSDDKYGVEYIKETRSKYNLFKYPQKEYISSVYIPKGMMKTISGDL